MIENWLTEEEVNELLDRIERNEPKGHPPGTVTNLIVPAEKLHELLMLWKAVRRCK
jgi:hypothetical protein